MLKIATVNVNGLRAAYRKGMDQWVVQNAPDVLLLQEVRAPSEIVHELLGDTWSITQQSCELKGRAGVAIATRLEVLAERIGLGSLQPEVPVDTGRWVENDLRLTDGSTLTVVSAYIHSGVANTPKMAEKFAYLDRVTERLRELYDTQAQVIVAGDLNIAHKEVDIKNWKGNLKTAGFLPEERAYLDRWFDEIGWIDAGRRFGGPGPGPYTWWSNRGQAFDNDAGWRIDYQLLTPALVEKLSKIEVHRATSYDLRWSDHAPLVADFELGN